jgi:peptidoglycan-N-acetylglucosamine deacetylase
LKGGLPPGAAVAARIAMRRTGTPEDIAHAVMAPASDYAGSAGPPGEGRANRETTMTEQKPLEPWQWPEEHWRKLVNQVRAGRPLRPKAWKNGARCAFAISFDSDHETNELRDGGGSISKLSQGQYGNRKGVPRILDVLKRQSVPASFYVPAVVALLYPDEQRRVVAEGHEVGIHGWIHERNAVLPLDAERDLQMRSADMLEKITGVRPVGIRTPSWDFSPHTLAISREMGLLYDSSLMADDDPYEILEDGQPTGMVELPVEWIKDDAIYFNMDRFSGLRPYTPPSSVLEIFTAEFDGAYAEHGLFLLTMHPHIIGHRSRVALLERLIEHIRGHAGVWFATHADIARYVKEASRLSTP